MFAPPRAYVLAQRLTPYGADAATLRAQLRTLSRHDPTIIWRPAGDDVWVYGRAQTELDSVIAGIRSAGIRSDAHPPQVLLRETIERRCDIDVTHARSGGAAPEFARIRILFEPVAPGDGWSFRSLIMGGAVPREYVPGVRTGLVDAAGCGLMTDDAAVDLRATLVDGAYHDLDSSESAFAAAARAAFERLRRQAEIVVLEPIMRVAVQAPDEHAGDVIGDLNSRGAQILGTESLAGDIRVTADVPMAQLLGYESQLRAFCGARGTVVMSLDHFRRLDDDGPPDTFPGEMALRA